MFLSDKLNSCHLGNRLDYMDEWFFFIVTSLFLCNQFSPSHHFVHKTYASCTVIIFSVQRNLNHIEKQDIQFQGWIRLWYFEMVLKRK